MLLTLSKCIPSGKVFGIRDTVGEFSRESVSRYVYHQYELSGAEIWIDWMKTTRE